MTLWADPRNEARGIVHPASTENTDTSQLKRWVDAPLDERRADVRARAPEGLEPRLRPRHRRSRRHGRPHHGRQRPRDEHRRATPTARRSRRPGGTRRAGASRRRASTRCSSNELGTRAALAHGLACGSRRRTSGDEPRSARRAARDRRRRHRSAARSSRSAGCTTRAPERDAVTALLSEEARDLAQALDVPRRARRAWRSSTRACAGCSARNLQDVFSADGLKKAHPELDYKARFAGGAAVNAAFARRGDEAQPRPLRELRRRRLRHARQQLPRRRRSSSRRPSTSSPRSCKSLDATPHPTQPGAKLSEHTHILVVSEFCRTPQINLGMGRDHYPNNSALVDLAAVPKANFVFGKSDPDQLLPRRRARVHRRRARHRAARSARDVPRRVRRRSRASTCATARSCGSSCAHEGAVRARRVPPGSRRPRRMRRPRRTRAPRAP